MDLGGGSMTAHAQFAAFLLVRCPEIARFYAGAAPALRSPQPWEAIINLGTPLDEVVAALGEPDSRTPSALVYLLPGFTHHVVTVRLLRSAATSLAVFEVGLNALRPADFDWLRTCQLDEIVERSSQTGAPRSLVEERLGPARDETGWWPYSSCSYEANHGVEYGLGIAVGRSTPQRQPTRR